MIGQHPATVPASSDARPAITARGLSKRFGRVLALSGLDLDVPTGTIFGLLGPNGAGKTTTIRILTGLAQPTAGSATVDGIPVGLDRTDLRRRIGYLDQDPRFYSWMRGRELLDLVGRLAGLSGAPLRSRLDEMLERVGLDDAADRRIGGYSGGMRQRLGVAQALLGRPSVLFLDEPVSSLDPEGRRDLLELIGSLRGEMTVVLSTHVLADVERVCDRVAILDRGRLVIESGLEDLLTAHARPIYRLIPEPDQASIIDALLDALRKAGWVESVAVARGGALRITVADPGEAAASIVPLLAATGVRVQSLERARPSLEEVFLTLIGPRGADEVDGRGFVRPREVDA